MSVSLFIWTKPKNIIFLKAILHEAEKCSLRLAVQQCQLAVAKKYMLRVTHHVYAGKRRILYTFRQFFIFGDMSIFCYAVNDLCSREIQDEKLLNKINTNVF